MLKAETVDLDDPAVTLALLKLNAVVGVRGFTDRAGNLDSVGITCALCHSTVDDSLAPGIGARRDGWANRDLNIGAIAALAPSVAPFAQLLGVDEATVRKVFTSWGPGKFDAELLLDGKAFQPDGRSAATLIPPAFGLAGVNLHTYTGWGSVTHWNAFVAVLEMQGKGTFYDPRLDDASKFPIAAANGFGNVRREPDLVTPKLGALHFYQLAIPAPPAPKAASMRGRPSAARHCLRPTARPAARIATSRRSIPSPASICTRPRRSALTRFKRNGARRMATARRRCAGSGRTRRAASITTGGSRLCPTSSTTTTRFRAWGSTAARRAISSSS